MLTATAPDVSRVRFLMPVTGRFVFMNHAALAPMPSTAAERVAEAARVVAATGDLHWPDRQRGIASAREDAARLLGCGEPSRIAFTENTSTALSLVAEGLPWREGDNVVGAACEYPSNVYPWMNLGRRGVELRLAPEVGGRVPAEELFARVDRRTRVLALSWVQYATGFRSDLAAIGAFCRERGVLFVVDAIQGLGALALDAEAAGCDVVAAAAHKWLLGPEGVGLLYLGPRAVERLHPVHAGWRSVRHMFDWDRFELDWNEGALALEAGTLNAFGILALGASLELLLEVGIESIEARVLALTARLADGLGGAGYAIHSPWGAGERSGILSLRHPRRPADELAARLAGRGIRVAHRAGRLRIAPHFYNTEEEVDRVVAELAAL
jgi:cysteine desulfurase / selenocysteine lyase